MKRETKLTRRETLLKLLAGGGALSLAGCGLDARSPAALAVLESAEKLTRLAQRALLAPREALAREYRPEDISSCFRPNGSIAPDDPDYQDALATNFADWRLEVGGLVDNPLKLSLADLRAMPSRSQITRHDCVEGWSCIAQMERRAAGERARRRRAEARGALHRLLLRRHARTDARRQRPILRDDRPRRRLSSADDPRLRDERRAAAGRARRAAAG